jgi:hypothetical protein
MWRVRSEKLTPSAGHGLGNRNLNIFGHPSQLRRQTGEQLSLCLVGREAAYQGTVFGVRAKLLKLFLQVFHVPENAQKDRRLNVQK